MGHSGGGMRKWIHVKSSSSKQIEVKMVVIYFHCLWFPKSRCFKLDSSINFLISHIRKVVRIQALKILISVGVQYSVPVHSSTYTYQTESFKSLQNGEIHFILSSIFVILKYFHLFILLYPKYNALKLNFFFNFCSECKSKQKISICISNNQFFKKSTWVI